MAKDHRLTFCPGWPWWQRYQVWVKVVVIPATGLFFVVWLIGRATDLPNKKGRVVHLCKFTVPFVLTGLGIKRQRWEVRFPV